MTDRRPKPTNFEIVYTAFFYEEAHTCTRLYCFINYEILGLIATTMAVKLKSVYKLFHMSGDIVYALLFPQLTAAMYMPEYVNWFGSTCAFIVGLLLRFMSGEPFLGIEAYIHWPGFITGKHLV